MTGLSSTAVSTIGLVLDLVGVVLVFFWGFPMEVVMMRDHSIRVKKLKPHAKIGLTLIVVGFAIQILGNWV